MKLSKIYYWILPALALFGMASCKKQSGLGFTPGTGAPTISSVQTINKYKPDTVIQSTTTYNSSGIVTTVLDTNLHHTSVMAFDSTTATGNLGTMYKINGANLGSATKLTINGVNVYYNRSLGSDNAIIFTLPTNVPYVQPQPNTMVITTLHGSVTYKFTTLPPPPTILQVSDFDFWSNTQLRLSGKGFASVSAVKLVATGEAMSIVSQNDSTLVLKAPASSSATESTLLFTYTSGSNANAQTASTTVFNNLDKAYNIVFNNSFQNGWGDNSWSGPSGIQSGTAHAVGGTASAEASFPAGGWKVEGFANWWPGFTYDPSYKYLTFWVKGGTVAHKLVLTGNQMVGGYGQVTVSNAYAAQVINIPPTVWTFVKIPLTAPSTAYSQLSPLLNFWANGTTANQLGFFLQSGQNSVADVDETYYFDEVAFIK
ncbi:hypothetical protein [Mucilaginibacter sp.]|uniref:hypothetical protein n=1 Tax=Mucilaginibacter sp. TaxID=1882438 RepID=UPI0028505599|nr:hypothetical protein [Mucilaginibacter sp.]MDR3696431.1 hypothetical protein [Mucilaginibacter sp.]